MLNRTKVVVEDLKKAGFRRKDFSVRTKQDKSNGGWKDAEIQIKTSNIKNKLEVEETFQEYMRKRFKNLVKNNTNENYRITEWHTSKRIRYTISINKKSRLQIHKGIKKENNRKVSDIKIIVESN